MDAENRKREETPFHWNIVKGSQNTGEKKKPKTKQQGDWRNLKDKYVLKVLVLQTQKGGQRMGEVWEEEVNDGSQIDLCIRITERALIISKD